MESMSQNNMKVIQIIIIIAVALLAAYGMVDYFIYTSQRSKDLLVEKNILQLSEDIGDYVSNNDRLPNSLNDIKSKDDGVNELIKSGLLSYKAELSKITSDTTYQQKYNDYEYKYQLCANFDYEKKSSYSYEYGDYGDGYIYSPSSDHPKGSYCYKLKTY